MRGICILICLLLAPVCVVAMPNAEKVILILDASGSMWGQVDSRPKISIARDVIQNLVKDWDPEIDLGLMAYGHRRKGDCNDIELIVATGPVSPSEIKKAITEIVPKGKTPLTRAVQLAAAELKYTEEKATIILISDGIETCNLDVCKVSQDLEKNGIDFTAHVIGFDLKESEAVQQLTCIAENTGGKFLSADTAVQLKSSLEATVKEIISAKSHNVELVAVTIPGGDPVLNVNWSVYAADKPDGAAVAWGKGALPEYTLAPGNYIARVKSIGGQATAEQRFTVPPKGVHREEVVLPEEGVLQLYAVNSKGDAPLSDVRWTVKEQGDNGTQAGKTLAYGKGAQPEYRLLPGTYIAEVQSSGGKAAATQVVTVRPGVLNRVEVVLAREGIIRLASRHTATGAALDGVSWIIKDPESGETVAYGKGATPEYQLLPGTYQAVVKSVRGKATAIEEITVLPGTEQDITVILPEEGVIRPVAVNSKGGNPLANVAWTIQSLPDAIQKGKTVAYGGGATPEYQLLPGRYLAKVKSLGGKATMEQEVEVVAGIARKIEVLLPEEGQVQLLAVTEPGGNPLSDVAWEVFTVVESQSMDKPELLVYGKGPTPDYKLLPGTYEARVRSRKGVARATKIFTLKAGEKLSVEVPFPQEGTLELSALFQTGVAASGVNWEVFSKSDLENTGAPKRVQYGSGVSRSFTLLPGSYLVVATFNNKKFKKEVEVLPGQVVQEAVPVQ